MHVHSMNVFLKDKALFEVFSPAAKLHTPSCYNPRETTRPKPPQASASAPEKKKKGWEEKIHSVWNAHVVEPCSFFFL